MLKDKALLLPPGFTGKTPDGYQVLYTTAFKTTSSVLAVNQNNNKTFTQIKTAGVLETVPHLRDVLKKLDFLLAVYGELHIQYLVEHDLYSGGYFLRPLSYLMYEISLSYGLRYHLKEKKIDGNIYRLIYEKQASFNPVDDTIDCWTFGIVSDGRKNDRIKAIIDQIAAFKIPRYEVLICGPAPDFALPPNVKLLTDAELYRDIRVPITAKKNKLINNAAYNNLVLLHDRISFPDNWYTRQKEYGNCFEILCNKVLDEDTHQKRVHDWMTFDRDFFQYQIQQAGILNYDDWNENIYVDGGFIIAKKHVLLAVNGYNEALHWGEAEDYNLSKRLYDAGYITNIDTNNEVYTQTHRHGGIALDYKALQLNLLQTLKRDTLHLRRLTKEKKLFEKYIKTVKI